MRFTGARGIDIRFSDSVVGKLHGFKQVSKGKNESGGILLGKISACMSAYLIEEITEPMSSDRSTRNTFYRSSAHQEMAYSRWQESNGYCLYLGLWHTHPEPNPKPSSVDRNDWTKAINLGRYEGDSLLFIIVGTKKTSCWMGRCVENETTFVKLKQVD